jgi:hypothetical protein
LDNSLVSLIHPSDNDSEASASNNTIQDEPTFLMRGLIGTTILLSGNENQIDTADGERGHQDYVLLLEDGDYSLMQVRFKGLSQTSAWQELTGVTIIIILAYSSKISL